MISGSQTEEQQREVFNEALTNAQDFGMPCLTSAGLSDAVMYAINGIGRAFPNVQPALVENAQRVFEAELAQESEESQ